ncbi:MAG: hypothetical protein J6M93_07040 [Succinivibrio sp.]|nr:hypothetical protein [Succinivibrio sp.]
MSVYEITLRYPSKDSVRIMYDLYYLHSLNPQFPVEEIALASSRLIDEGQFRDYGLSRMA